MNRFHVLLFVSSLFFSSCQSPTSETPQHRAQTTFFEALSSYCGQAFEGRVISSQEADADWRKETLVMHVAECSEDEIRIPLSVGDDRSRTWVVGWYEGNLRLKHIHRHKDGTLDDVTWYGGNANAKTAMWNDDPAMGVGGRIDFPVDDESKANFLDNDLDVSVNNTWSLGLMKDITFTYGLSRPEDVDGRDFRAAFDLQNPVPVPDGDHW